MHVPLFMSYENKQFNLPRLYLNNLLSVLWNFGGLDILTDSSFSIDPDSHPEDSKALCYVIRDKYIWAIKSNNLISTVIFPFLFCQSIMYEVWLLHWD